MKRLVDLETENDFSMFSEVVRRLKKPNIVGTVIQAQPDKDEEYRYVDLDQKVANGLAFMRVSDDYFYLTVKKLRKEEIGAFCDMWDLVLRHGTQRFKQQKENDYLFTIDLVYNELDKGYVYNISSVQPIMMTADGNDGLSFVFFIENTRVGKEQVSNYDIEFEENERKDSGGSIYNNLFMDTMDDGE